jgi:hypothetical protein
LRNLLRKRFKWKEALTNQAIFDMLGKNRIRRQTMAQRKRIIPYIVVGIVGFILMNLIASNALDMQVSASRLESTKLVNLHLLGTLYCFLLGVLLEWRTVERLIKKDIKMSFSPLLIPGLILLLISCISPVIVITRIGIDLPFPHGKSFLSFFTGPLAQSSRVQNLLAVIAGSMIIRGLSGKAPENQP